MFVVGTVMAPTATARPWQPDCKGYGAERTVRCAAAKFDPPGGVSKALSVWSCESHFGKEPPHSDSYHGPFQYSLSTYSNQRASMPRFVRWHDISPFVHNVRSNIVLAIGWAARNGWGPWSCA